MTAGEWVPGLSHEYVARRCGVAPATVKDWATSASRVIRLAVDGDKEDIRTRMLATLDTVIRRALGPKRGDLRAAVAAVESQAKLLGLVVQKHDVTNRPSVAHLTREEHQAELAKLKAEIDAELAREAAH